MCAPKRSGSSIWGGFPKIRGTFFWDPYNADYNILGVPLSRMRIIVFWESPYLGKLQSAPLAKQRPLQSLEQPELTIHGLGFRVYGLVAEC